MSSQASLHASLATLRPSVTSEGLPLLEDHLRPSHARKRHGITHIQAAFIGGLAGVQITGVIASIYLRAAMAGSQPPHPVVFALYREVIAGALCPRQCATFRTAPWPLLLKRGVIHSPLQGALISSL
jgi:hypothetical protein